MNQVIGWINENLGVTLTVTGVLGAAVGFFARNVASWFLETQKESRAAKADQKRAAIEFAHIVNEYRSHWIGQHFEDENAPPVEDHWVQWSGASFDPLISPEGRALHARLSSELRSEAFDLHELVRQKKELISQLSEYREEDLDFEGPIAVCEIALATDKLYRKVMQEAGLTVADLKYAFDSIQRRLSRAEKDKAEAAEANQRSWEQISAMRLEIEKRQAERKT